MIRSQFTQLHPADLLFQDQVGARGHRCDTNPAAPHPGAYLEGIHRIARIDCRHAALATEDGHERLIDFETAFCGLSWPWLRNRGSTRRLLYEDVWPEGTWQIEPITLYLAHDAALFYHHDLGGFVRDRRDLALSVALGYGLSFHIRSAAQLDGADGRWLECLHRIQHAVCARVAGTPLIEFNMLNPHAPRSAWGSGIEIVANLDAHQSLPIDDQCTIAPEGFLARRTPDAPAETPDDMEAGVVTRLGGREFGAQGKLVIREKSGDAWNEWVTELPILD